MFLPSCSQLQSRCISPACLEFLSWRTGLGSILLHLHHQTRHHSLGTWELFLQKLSCRHRTCKGDVHRLAGQDHSVVVCTSHTKIVQSFVLQLLWRWLLEFLFLLVSAIILCRELYTVTLKSRWMLQKITHFYISRRWRDELLWFTAKHWRKIL